MDIKQIYDIIVLILTVVFGFLCIYIQGKSGLKEKAAEAITNAENEYKDTTKAGGQKFQFAVDFLYNSLPAPLRMIVSKEMIGTIIQNTFESMERYAKAQLDRLVDKTTEQQ